jgi:hypothetical protein
MAIAFTDALPSENERTVACLGLRKADLLPGSGLLSTEEFAERFLEAHRPRNGSNTTILAPLALARADSGLRKARAMPFPLRH